LLVNKPKIVFLGTYPPRECGIATFTQDLFRNCQKILGTSVRCKVAALNVSPLDTYKYPPEVEWEIAQNIDADYIKLAREINKNIHISGVILQHEYGIFGGTDGEKILLFMQMCNKPIVVTLHTALPNPSEKMKSVTARIIDLASIIVVLTESSKQIIKHVYPKSTGKIFIIPHGVHGVEFSTQKEFKTKLELQNHIILSTFGLLSRGKGIEYVIHSLPKAIKKYPSILYLVLGETHPIIRRNEGEKYRLELAALVTSLHLENHVKFYDQYLNLHDLLEFLQATDIYISTSINPNQAVSGTLSYALGAGRAVISTKFAQAKEIISPEIGKLVPIMDSPAITAAILDLLEDDQKLKNMAQNAYRSTRSMLWSNVAKKYTNLLTRTIIPTLNIQHLIDMTDEIGLFQFAVLKNPNIETGYTLDDNCRALIVCSWLLKNKDSTKLRSLIHTYLSFIKQCQTQSGEFANYIGYDDKLPTNQNSHEDLEESHARAMWALSEILNASLLSTSMRRQAKNIYELSLEKGIKLTHARAKAYAIKSFANAIIAMPDQRKIYEEYINIYAQSLVVQLKENSVNSWQWFEKNLNYNNALLSESLLISGNTTENSVYTEKGIRSLQFLIEKTFSPDMYMPIGHSKWYRNNEKRSQYDQQPEDPASMIMALSSAYTFTKNETYKNLANKCFSWFLGNNSLNISLYDKQNGGCYDGLHPDRINLNQGAESQISYLMSSYIVGKLHS